MPGIKTVVISRTLRQADYPKLSIIGENAAEALRSMKEQSGKDIWLWGGGLLFRSLAEEHLVDSVEVAVIPVLLGGGIPLFPPPANQTKLTLTGHRLYPKTGTVSLEYAVR
jgi:dihydrofolate reductase